MKILYEILNELNYSSKETFSFSCIMKESEKTYEVIPFVSENYPSQVYLVVKIYNSELVHILNSDFLITLAKLFRKQSFHQAEMDKNTTLLLECECKENEVVDHRSKVQIEDDPYYFKKYVFSYSILEEKRAEEYMQNMKNKSEERFSIVEEIQRYLSSTDKFLSYKTNHSNQPTYTYFSELATKIPIFPLQIVAVDEIKSVTNFLTEELELLNSIDIDSLDQLLESEIDFKEESIESILWHWKMITTK